MRSASRRLQRDAAQGDRLAISAMILAKADADPHHVLYSASGQSKGRKIARLKARRLPLRLQDLSSGEECSGDIDVRVRQLSGMLADDGDSDAALGLAMCAARLGRIEEAYLFATESLRRGGRHPRAFCIAGLCELESGNRELAQQHLAAAARLARVRSDLRAEMRMAQRLLLFLNFGITGGGREADRKGDDLNVLP